VSLAAPLRSLFAIGLVLALSATLSFGQSSATQQSPAPRSAPRKILVLVKAREANHETNVRYLGGFLHKAGFDYEARDIESLLASPTGLSGYAGVVTAYLTNRMVGADRYPEFLVERLIARQPVIVVGTYGAYQNLTPKPDKTYAEAGVDASRLNAFFRPFGLEFNFAFCGDPTKLRAVRREHRFSEFETPLAAKDLNYYQLFKSIDLRNRVYLGVERTDLKASESAFIAHTPFGGMILEGYGSFWSPEKKAMVQRVDLAEFFREGLTRSLPEIVRAGPPASIPPTETQRVTPSAVSSVQPFTLTTTGPSPLVGPTITVSPRAFVGKVVVLFKKRDANHELHVKYLGDFVNEAGYDYDAVDVESLLERPRDLSGYDGIVTAYLSSEMVGAHKYPRFLLDQMEAGLPIVIIGSYGAYQGLLPKKGGTFNRWNEATKEINTFFWQFGLEFYFAFTSDSKKLRLKKHDKEFSEYEALLTAKDLTYFQLFRSVNRANRVHLSVERADIFDSESALVVHTPFGGMILEGYGFFWSPEKKLMLQRVHMAEFLKQALSREVGEVKRYEIGTHEDLVKVNPLPRRAPPILDPRPVQGEVLRRLLVLYKKSEAPKIEAHPFHARAEIAANHLGLIPEYWPIDVKGLPPADLVERCRGILTWHTTPFLENARAYGEWLLEQVQGGKKLAVIQDYGASVDPETQEEPVVQHQLFKELGLRTQKMKPPRVERAPTVRVTDDLIGFEHPADIRYVSYSRRTQSISPSCAVHFSLSDQAWGPIDLVSTAPNGGAALENAAFFFPPGNAERRELIEKALKGEIQVEVAEEPTIGSWIIDPFAFLDKTMGLDDVPAPDFTTINGSRIAYSHIDGDAFDSICLIDKAHVAGEVIIRSILEKYCVLPHTVSVISKQVETSGTEFYQPIVELARRMYRLPQVEIASHTTTHPFDWVEGDPYVVNPGQFPFEIAYREQKFTQEIWGSKLWIEKYLAPPGKPCNVLLWSGATNPDDRALEVAWRAGMENLNGGDPVFDSEHPSIAGLCPISTRQGPFRQYHTSAQNDYIYSLFLTGDWGGQRKVLDHFEKTGSPRRLLPMNLYYHFYSGIKKEGLEALTLVLDHLLARAKAGEIAPVFTSDYCRIAADYFTTRIIRDGADGWSVSNEGNLRTLRIKRPVHIDLDRSKGVIGYKQELGQTYVHLDGTRRRKVVLSATAPRMLYLRQASMIIDGSRRGPGCLELDLRGFGWAVFTIAGAHPSETHQITLLEQSGRPVVETQTVADSSGVLRFRHLLPPPSGHYTLRITRGNRPLPCERVAPQLKPAGGDALGRRREASLVRKR